MSTTSTPIAASVTRAMVAGVVRGGFHDVKVHDGARVVAAAQPGDTGVSGLERLGWAVSGCSRQLRAG